MNIVISGIHYPITAALECIVRAFKRRMDCTVISVGPFTGTFIPYGLVGMNLPESYCFKPDIILPEGALRIGNCPISYIETQLPEEFKPDLWLDVNAGFYIDGKPESGIRATYLTDPHVLRQLYNNIKHNYDYIFCPQTPYAGEKEFYLPYAYDMEWHSPIETEKLYDVAIVGNIYPQRVDLINQLKNMGKRTYFQLGIAKENAKLIYNQSITGINWSSMQDLTARVFELIGLGIVPILNRVPDLSGLFNEGENYLGFDNKEQAIIQVELALNDENIRNTIIKNNTKIRETGRHTWDARVQTLLEVCKLI